MRGYLLFIGLVTMVSCGTGETTKLQEGTYHVGKGEGRSFVLPDGSMVFLSPGTSISLAKGFAKDSRLIDLDGEARFDVTARGGIVFEVRTRDLTIEATMVTKFKVNAYRDKPGEEVDVLTGGLRVRKSYHSDTDNEQEMLKDGEMVMINRDIDLMEKEALNAAELEKLKGLW